MLKILGCIALVYWACGPLWAPIAKAFVFDERYEGTYDWQKQSFSAIQGYIEHYTDAQGTLKHGICLRQLDWKHNPNKNSTFQLMTLQNTWPYSKPLLRQVLDITLLNNTIHSLISSQLKKNKSFYSTCMVGLSSSVVTLSDLGAFWPVGLMTCGFLVHELYTYHVYKADLKMFASWLKSEIFPHEFLLETQRLETNNQVYKIYQQAIETAIDTQKLIPSPPCTAAILEETRPNN